MSHFISYEVLTVETCPYRNLFNEVFLENMRDKETFQHSNIYFICKTKKVRFNLNETKLIDKTDIKTQLILGHKEKYVDCQASLYDLLKIFSTFCKSKKEFENIVRSKNPIFSLDYKSDLSKSDMLATPLRMANREDYPIYLLPENFEVVCNIDFQNEPEVLYIGQSFRMLDRIQSHKTLHKAVSQINDDEEVKVYFITFKYGYGGEKEDAKFQGPMWNYWLNRERDNDDYKTKIDLIERFLIHFFKPIYNDQHTNANMMTDKLVKEILLKEKVSTMTVGLGVYGFGYSFWSNSQPLKSEMYSFDVRNPELGYQEGLIIDWN